MHKVRKRIKMDNGSNKNNKSIVSNSGGGYGDGSGSRSSNGCSNSSIRSNSSCIMRKTSKQNSCLVCIMHNLHLRENLPNETNLENICV